MGISKQRSASRKSVMANAVSRFEADRGRSSDARMVAHTVSMANAVDLAALVEMAAITLRGKVPDK